MFASARTENNNAGIHLKSCVAPLWAVAMIRVRRLTLILKQTVGELDSQRDLSAGHNHPAQNKRFLIKCKYFQIPKACLNRLFAVNASSASTDSINRALSPQLSSWAPLCLFIYFIILLPSVCSSASCILESTLKPFVLDPTHCWRRHLGGAEPSAEPSTWIIQGFPSAEPNIFATSGCLPADSRRTRWWWQRSIRCCQLSSLLLPTGHIQVEAIRGAGLQRAEMHLLPHGSGASETPRLRRGVNQSFMSFRHRSKQDAK